MASILVVEDSLDCVEVIERALGEHDLCVAGCLSDARERLAIEPDYDLMLLDLELPDGDGLRLCAEISKAGETRIPVIFLTARRDVRDKVTAFSLGAEDYIEKPVDVLELQARVSARLRKMEDQQQRIKILERGDVRIDVQAVRTLHVRGNATRELDLSPTEHRLLRLLAERPSHLVSRDRMMSEVWGDTIVGPRTIDSHVSKLRRKLGETRCRIESVRGLGYRLEIAPQVGAEADD